MSKYYVFDDGISDFENQAILEGRCAFLQLSELTFDTGTSIQLQNSLKVFVDKNSVRGEMTEYLNLEEIEGLVVSKNVEKLWRKLNINNIEYFHVLLTDEYHNFDEVMMAELHSKELEYETVVYNNYSIANVVGLVDCVNHRASKLEYYGIQRDIKKMSPIERDQYLEKEQDNDIDFIRNLVLDENKIPEDLKIFRLKDCPRILIFKEEVVTGY